MSEEKRNPKIIAEFFRGAKDHEEGRPCKPPRKRGPERNAYLNGWRSEQTEAPRP